MSTIAIGPYRFSRRDAQRLVRDTDEIWKGLSRGRDASVIAALRPTFTGDEEADLRALWRAWLAAGPALRAAGQLPAQARGEVAQLNVSDGGVPKRPVDHLDVDHGGARGDRQGNRKHHGSPAQALCVWSAEVVDALRADGHPITCGAAGENITARGLHWPDVRPGVRLQVGGVLAEVTCYATPCRHQAQWFHDGDYSRIHEDRGSLARVYAVVLEPGRVSTGDTVTLEP